MVHWTAALLFLAWAMPAAAAPYGLGVELPVATGAGDQLESDVKGSVVTYTDRATPAPRVFLWDENTLANTAAAGGTEPQGQPSLSQDRLVFTEGASSRNVRAQLLPAQTSVALDPSSAIQSHPSVSSRLVTWEDGRDGDLRIRVHDLLLGSGSIDITGAGQHRLPRADQDYVVYSDESEGGVVKLWRSGTGTSVIHPGPSGSADLDGTQGLVALERPGDNGESDIAVYDATGEEKAHLSLKGGQRSPRISGAWVALEDQSTGVSRVVLWNWETGDLLLPVVGNTEQRLGNLDWPRVVYSDKRSGNFDVFLYHDGESTTPDGGDGGQDGGDDGGQDGGDDGGHDGGHDGGDCHHHFRCHCHRHHCHCHFQRHCPSHHDDDEHDDDDDDDCDDDDRDDKVSAQITPGQHDGEDDGEMGMLVESSACDDPTRPVIAELRLETTNGAPVANEMFFDSQGGAVIACIEQSGVGSGWVVVNRMAVGTPNDFDTSSGRSIRGLEVQSGRNQLGAIAAGNPGGWLQIRIRGPQVTSPPNPPACGCTSAGAGLVFPLLGLLALRLKRRREQ